MTHLAVVLNILQDNGLFDNLKKCWFVQEKIEYLGHWISAQGVEVDPEKVRVTLQWPQPTNLKELRRFLGLIDITNTLWNIMVRWLPPDSATQKRCVCVEQPGH